MKKPMKWKLGVTQWFLGASRNLSQVLRIWALATKLPLVRHPSSKFLLLEGRKVLTRFSKNTQYGSESLPYAVSIILWSLLIVDSTSNCSGTAFDQVPSNRMLPYYEGHPLASLYEGFEDFGFQIFSFTRLILSAIGLHAACNTSVMAKAPG